MKRCRKCDRDLPHAAFPIQYGRPISPCRECANAANRRKADERRAAFLYRHPRCCICSGPLRRTGNYTCSRACSVKRWNWFGRMKGAA